MTELQRETHNRGEKDRGRRWFRDLPSDLKGTLGDDFVLGTFDWREWGLDAKPSRMFLNGADEARMDWECMT